MSLTPIQRKFLTKYKSYRSTPYTFGRRLLVIPLTLAFFSIFGAVAWFYVSPHLAVFVGGMGFASIIQQATLLWRARQVMPTLIDVIDWDKVDRLLRESEFA